MAILLFFSFLAGFVTILAPCIWPLLPIVLSASAGQGKQRPLGITLGVMTSFTIFTLSISYLEKILHFDANIFRLLAVIIIGFLGITMLVPALGTAFENFINRVLSPFQSKLQQKGAGFVAGYSTGFSIGLVWAPCAGPILATVATLAATQAVDIKVIAVTLAYVFGLSVPLFIFSLLGSKVFGKVRQLTRYTGIIQQVFGLIMIVAAVLMYTNYDKVIQVKVLELFPSYGNLLSSVENNDHVAKQLRVLRKEVPILEKSTEGDDALADMGPAVDFVGITQWLNGPALNLEQLRGKVVLVDFWTYSCVNCVRTLPHVTGWYGKYKDNGFVVIGVHTPEFAFEKQANNVQNALKQFKINYPVALDNDFGTWQAYHNHYWPAEYLIDVKGHLRHTHFGEGHYDQMEKAIRALLKEAGNTLDVGLSNNEDMTPQYGRTPETYLGSSRIERFVSYQKPNGQQQSFTHPKKIPKDQFAFEGMWQVSDESAKAGNGAALEFHFKASKVFLVMGPSAEGGRVNVFIDGKPVDASIAGADVNQGVITLDSERLYDLINLKGKVEEHVLRLEFNGQDTEIYAFTFG